MNHRDPFETWLDERRRIRPGPDFTERVMRAVARPAIRPSRHTDWLRRSYRAVSLGAAALSVLVVHVALVLTIVLFASTAAY
jgi:hypothetical protein